MTAAALLDGLPALLTVGEAADVLRCSTQTVRRMISRGQLRATRVRPAGSSRVLIPRASLESILRDGMEGAA